MRSARSTSARISVRIVPFSVMHMNQSVALLRGRKVKGGLRRRAGNHQVWKRLGRNVRSVWYETMSLAVMITITVFAGMMMSPVTFTSSTLPFRTARDLLSIFITFSGHRSVIVIDKCSLVSYGATPSSSSLLPLAHNDCTATEGSPRSRSCLANCSSELLDRASKYMCAGRRS